MITSNHTTGKRYKVNFMIEEHLIASINKDIPAGKRSDFVNDALTEYIVKFKRKKAFRMMDELREKANIRISTKEMIKRKNYGRP